MSHYNQQYFSWQSKVGEFGGMANRFKFAEFIQPQDVLIDYGCGGGFLLQQIDCQQKVGIEVSDTARQYAIEHLGMNVYSSIDDVPDNFATIIISNHVLEHVDSPLGELKRLYPKLRQNGRLVFVVPHQKPDEAYRTDDPNNHLYTWNPLTLGNLFTAAGYEVMKVDVIRHSWPPRYRGIHRTFGQTGFDLACKAYSYLKGIYQIRVYARKT